MAAVLVNPAGAVEPVRFEIRSNADLDALCSTRLADSSKESVNQAYQQGKQDAQRLSRNL